MAFNVLSCTDADMYPAFVLVSETFNHDQPYHDAIYPLHWTQGGRDDGAIRFWETKNGEPNVRFLKAVENTTGDLAGLVRYYIYEDGLEENELQGDWWKDGEEKAYAQHLYRNYLTTRHATVKAVKGPIIYISSSGIEGSINVLHSCIVADTIPGLDLLTVHPKYQSKGAGTSLVRWGTDLATQMGAEVRLPWPSSHQLRAKMKTYKGLPDGFPADDSREFCSWS